MDTIPGGGAILVVIAIAVIVMILMAIASRLYRKEPPNKALIIYGGGSRHRATTIDGQAQVVSRVLVGGGAVVWPWVQSAKVLGLEQFPVPVQDQNVPSKDNILVDVSGTAIVKVGATTAMITTAAQNFLDRETSMQPNIQRVLQGHLRAAVASMTVDDLVHNHEAFQSQIANKSKPELETMGLDLLTLTISSVTDKVEFIVNKGKPAIAEVQKLAAIAQAENQRQAAERTATENQAAQEAQLLAATAVAEATRDRDLKVASFTQQTASAQAEAAMAGPLKTAEIQKSLATREGEAAIEKERQNAATQEQAAVVAQNRTRAEIVVPAEAAKEAAIATAAGQKAKTIAEAEGSAKATELNAAATKATGLAAADVLKASKMAEADGEQALANSRAANNNVNLQQFAIEQYFTFRTNQAKFNAEAIGDFGQRVSITQIGGGNGDGHGMLGGPTEVARFLATLNAEGEALTGMNLADLSTRFRDFIKGFQTPETAAAPESTRGPD